MLSPYIYFLGGHYPSAKSIPFADNLLDKHTNMLQTPEQQLRGWLCDYGLSGVARGHGGHAPPPPPNFWRMFFFLQLIYVIIFQCVSDH